MKPDWANTPLVLLVELLTKAESTLRALQRTQRVNPARSVRFGAMVTLGKLVVFGVWVVDGSGVGQGNAARDLGDGLGK